MSFDRASRAIALLGLIAFALVAGSCDARSVVHHPQFPNGGLLAGAAPVKLELLARLNGMYGVTAGNGRFGDVVAVRASPDALSIFAEPNATYAIMRAGCIESGAKLVMEGHWRYPAETDTGLLRMFVGPPAVAKALCAGTAAPLDTPTIDGLLGVESDDPSEPLTLSFQKALFKSEGRFAVVGHHGACRTIDDCGASENSIETLKLVQAYGADIAEIDAQLTKDGVPILFHDDNFGPRLTNGPYCHGPVHDFTLAHIRALCTLKFGEAVPTLEEALDAAFTQTLLRAIWIDAKSPEVVAPVIDVMARFILRTQGSPRKMGLIIGLGETEILDAYKAASPPPGVQCLVELDPSDVRANGCIAWGPRYTRGPMTDDVRSLQADGHLVAFWTMDEEDYIKLFLKSGAMPNGILSDRDGLVFWLFQTIATEATLPPERPGL
jgi:glycerophosphoryl diester phosphodiesterase